jgi:hypothetical protein
MDQFESPATFTPRLNFATADSELAGISLDWGDSFDLQNHLLIALKLTDFFVALLLIDTDWKIVALLRIPIVLKKHHANDSVGAIGSAKLRILRQDETSFEGILYVEQGWHRDYLPDPPRPGDGGTSLSSYNTSWYRLKGLGLSENPILQCELEKTEIERSDVHFCVGGDKGYWLSRTIRLPPPGPRTPDMHSDGSLLDIAVAGANGLPLEWRCVSELDWAYHQSSPSRDRNRILINTTRPYDRDHAISLISFDGKLHLALLRFADGKMLSPIKIPLSSGWRERLAWHHSLSSGTLWFFLSNEKRSAAKRDSCLWRVDYGSRLFTAKRASDALQVTRLSEDRVMTEKAILDYGNIAFAMWENGVNVTKPNAMRCSIFRRDGDTESKPSVPAWTSQSADGFLRSLPIKDWGERPWMGKQVVIPETRQFPRKAFKFGTRLGVAVLCWYFNPYRTELTIGEIELSPGDAPGRFS